MTGSHALRMAVHNYALLLRSTCKVHSEKRLMTIHSVSSIPKVHSFLTNVHIPYSHNGQAAIALLIQQIQSHQIHLTSRSTRRLLKICSIAKQFSDVLRGHRTPKSPKGSGKRGYGQTFSFLG